MDYKEKFSIEEIESRMLEMGKVANEIKKELPSLVLVEGYYKDVCEIVEEEIKNNGFIPAFPTNVSVNEITAHDTAAYDDKRVFKDNDLVKVDFGIMDEEGFIVDTSQPINLGNDETNTTLIEAVKYALENVKKILKPGITIKEISSTIESSIRSKGAKPISNLTGHFIRPFEIHAGISIPNITTESIITLNEGDIFAIEPFATLPNAKGYVKDSTRVEIYALNDIRVPRLRFSRKLLEEIIEKYKTAPFAERWIYNVLNNELKTRAAIRELLKIHAIEAYPVLIEASSQKVSQIESTFLVREKDVLLIS